MSQDIRDMLTQRQTTYVWEAYLKHRKLEKKTDRASHSEENQNPDPPSAGKAGKVGHNKHCTDKE